MSALIRTVVAALATLATCCPAEAARDPLQRNLGALEQRLQGSSPKSAPRPKSNRRIRVRSPRRTASSGPRAVHVPAEGALTVVPQVTYQPERIGTRETAGDLRVEAAAGAGRVHVYLGQRLISDGGNGRASVPDLLPGKHPVSVWATGRRKRKTIGVRVLPGKVACLTVKW